MNLIINNTIEAYELFTEGSITLEDLKYCIEQGLISENLLLELESASHDDHIKELKHKLKIHRQKVYNNLDGHVINVDDYEHKIANLADKHQKSKHELYEKIVKDAMKHVDEKSKDLRDIKDESENIKSKDDYKRLKHKLHKIDSEISRKNVRYRDLYFKKGTTLGRAVTHPVTIGAALGHAGVTTFKYLRDNGLI